jgi:hypothetical protein
LDSWVRLFRGLLRACQCVVLAVLSWTEVTVGH